jgi:glycosyltransferase involved in cell wall biosynthesis
VTPTFLVVTAVRNGGDYLPRCCRSVADQQGVRVEHVVRDACSTDSTPEWMRRWTAERVAAGGAGYRVQWVREPDGGLYDALNRGFGDAPQADYLGWLNADEQYLPGALAAAAGAFARDPACDLLTGDALVVDPRGDLLAFRRGQPLRGAWVRAAHLYDFSCAMYFRRRVWESGLRFDPGLRSCGDADWVVRVLAAGFRARHLRRFQAAFALHGANLGAGATSLEEEQAWRRRASPALRALGPAVNGVRLLAKAAGGAYVRPREIAYELYPPDGGSRRRFEARRPSARWPRFARGAAARAGTSS